MQVDLTRNYYELFEMPVQFELDYDHLTSRFRALQKALHPDRFAGATETEKRWSVQAASFVNEAYQTLSKPIARAGYMLSLNGISIDEETDTQMSPSFLMEQMEMREALEAAVETDEPFVALERLAGQLKVGSEQQAAAFAGAAASADWQAGRTVVRQWQFLDKLQREVRDAEERLDVYGERL